MTNKQKRTILSGVGMGIRIGIVAVATAPAWLAVQYVLRKKGGNKNDK